MNAERSAFLQVLVREGYLPSEDFVVAFGELSGRPVPMTSDAVEGRLRKLRTEIDDFSERYWDYSPDERRTRWTALDERSRAFAPDEFLIHLQKGLDAIGTTVGTEEEVELIATARRLFRSRPRAKTVARLAWLAEHRDAKWARTAQNITKTDPPTAGLEPEFFRAVAFPPSPPTNVSEDHRTTAPRERRSTTPEEDYAAQQQRLASASVTAAKNATTDGLGGLGGRIGSGVVIFVLIFGLRAACYSVKSPSPNPVPPTTGRSGYDYVPPKPRPVTESSTANPPIQRIPFTPEQVAEFEAFDPNGNRIPPKGYYLWKLQRDLEKRPKPTVPAGK